ncbi:hypothetical protein [Micromonospora sp. NPDC023888]|uniref:hypothetical protein n=1 Tax=Micromonospora sp. NPDC023888 TaxID=3155607 RepID=UPI0033FEE0DF
MNAIVARVPAAPRCTRLSLWGLVVGILGLLIQWIADPGKFPAFPPGIVFIVVCGALVVFTGRRWWAPVFSVLISLWIVLGGWAAGQLTPNFRSENVGTVAGNVVMSLGLAFAAITGVVAMLGAWQARAR